MRLPGRDALAARLDALRRDEKLPALAAALLTGDAVAAAAVGSRRADGPETVTDGDHFHIGSNGKAMTAVLAGLLVDQGRLAWESPLPALFPELAGTMHPAWRPVTLADLLTHTSGLAPNPPPAAPAPSLGGDAPRAQRWAAVAAALGQAPTGRHGRHEYSNLGYIVAGAAAERAADRAYEELVIARVLAPLGVISAGFGASGAAGADSQPLGHEASWLGRRRAVEPGPTADNPPAFSPAGRVHLSVGDYARFVQLVLAGLRGRDGVVRAATLRAMAGMSAPSGAGGARYTAAGWLAVPRGWAGGEAYTHAGSNTLNFAVAWLAPARDLAALVLTNQGGPLAPAAADRVVGALLREATGGG